MNSINNSNIFFNVYRNKYIQDIIFNNLGRARVCDGFYFFKNGSVFEEFHDISLETILKSNSKSVLIEKLQNYKQLFNTNGKIDYKYDHLHPSTYYHHWLDNVTPNFHCDLRKVAFVDATVLKLLLDCNVIEFPLSGTEELNGTQDISLDAMKLLVEHFPKHFYPVNTRNGDLQPFHSRSVLEFLIQQKKTEMYQPFWMTNDPFFIENKDLYRLVPGWDDLKFLNQLLQADLELVENKEVFIWVLKQTPLFKVTPDTQCIDKLCGVEIDVDKMKSYSNTTLPYSCEEVILFFIKHDRSTLKNNMKTLFIFNLKVLHIVHQFIQDEGMDVSTISFEIYSSDIKCFLYLTTNMNVNGKNIKGWYFGHDENEVDLVLDINIGLIQVDDFKKPFTFELVKKLHQRGVNVLAPGPGYAYNQCIKRGNLDFLRYYIEHIKPHHIIPYKELVDIYRFSKPEQQEEALKFIYQYSETVYDNAGALSERLYANLFHAAITKYDSDNILKFLNKIKDPMVALQEALPKAYNALEGAKDKQQKQSIITLLAKLKNEYSSQLKQDLFAKKRMDISTPHTIYLQDPQFFFEIYSSVIDPINFFISAIKISSVAVLKRILSIQDTQTKDALACQIEKILLNYLSLSCTRLKVPLFIFHHFSKQFSQSTLDKLVTIVLKAQSIQWIDILLHKTKIRLLKPASKEQDDAMLQRNYSNMLKSKYYSSQLVPKLDIVVPENHQFTDYECPSEVESQFPPF
ncbi:hypothetical protein CYY_002434 [Polysphondylium violaceum]|uniref:Uncharacterized protein n=1 Tax=Polysphondylium violaceum TaxID=133409 RepID=A0A8J4Q7W5_9MYCE|nr:hypothetical protein CYY_002434 [Polysphondylium violaceum]